MESTYSEQFEADKEALKIISSAFISLTEENKRLNLEIIELDKNNIEDIKIIIDLNENLKATNIKLSNENNNLKEENTKLNQMIESLLDIGKQKCNPIEDNV